MNEWFSRRPDAVAWQTTDLTSLGLTETQCRDAVQFVSRGMKVSAGADAAARVMIVAGFPWALAGRIMLLPGVRSVARAVYRWVARNRRRFRGDPVA